MNRSENEQNDHDPPDWAINLLESTATHRIRAECNNRDLICEFLSLFLQEIIVTEDCSGENDDNQRISKLDGSSINSELQTILDEQKVINEVLCQPFPSRVVSCTETELELELAAIAVSEGSDNHFESTPVTPAVTDQKNA